MTMPTMLPRPTTQPFNRYQTPSKPYTFGLNLPHDFFEAAELDGEAQMFPAHPTNFGKWSGGHAVRCDPRALVWHTPEEPKDSWEATPNWFANPKANSSTHWYNDDDGDLIQQLSEVDCSWGQGTSANKNRTWKGEINALAPWSTGDNNLVSLGMECEGYAHNFQWTDKQRRSALAWGVYKSLQYKIPIDRIHWAEHRELATNKTDPGNGFDLDALVADALVLKADWLGGDTMSPNVVVKPKAMADGQYVYEVRVSP